MARAPFQVLVFPFRPTDDGFEYAVFRRADGDGQVWQAISGGGEDDETPLAAALREMAEEGGIAPSAELIVLDARASIPAHGFAACALWGPNVYVIPEHAFAVRLGPGDDVALSDEHHEHLWLPYQAAWERLTWQSNRVALGELHTRRGRR